MPLSRSEISAKLSDGRNGNVVNKYTRSHKASSGLLRQNVRKMP